MLFLEYQSIGENIRTQVNNVLGKTLITTEDETLNYVLRWNHKKKGIEDQHFEVI
jgi:hypothetical protein